MTGSSSEGMRDRRVIVALGLVCAVGLVYAVVALLRLTRFDMTAFDAGIFDNVLWRLAHGYDDVTALTGSHHFSDHLSFLVLLFVPVYAIVPSLGLPVMIVAQAASVALVGWATWLLVDHLDLRLEQRQAAMLVVLAGAGAYNAAVIDVHEVGLALGPLAMTVVLAMRNQRLRAYWVWPALAAMARIDIAVSVVLIGVLLRRDRPSHARLSMAIGSLVALTMGLWLFLNPWEGTSFSFHFAHLGIQTVSELPGAVLADPLAAVDPLLDPTMWATLAIWLIGFMLVPPLRAARWIIPALPTLLIPILGSWPQADEPHLHYWHVLVPMLAVATAIGLARWPGMANHAFAIAIVAAGTTWVLMGMFKPTFGTDLTDERQAVAWLNARPTASVAAYPSLVPHVTLRPTVMQLPTPFSCPSRPVASFVGPDDPPDLVAVPEVVVTDPADDAQRSISEVLMGYYETVAVFGGLQIWERVSQVPPAAYSIECGVNGQV